MDVETFDYIIVGAGSAGCVLADRLTEDGRSSVLVLEYGGSDRSVFIQMPAALSIPMNSKTYNWGYWSEPEPHLGGRGIVKLNSIAPVWVPGRGRASLFLLMNRRGAGRDSKPKIAYTYLP